MQKSVVIHSDIFHAKSSYRKAIKREVSGELMVAICNTICNNLNVCQVFCRLLSSDFQLFPIYGYCRSSHEDHLRPLKLPKVLAPLFL